MKLKNGLSSILFLPLPDALQDKITIASTCELTPHEREIFFVAFHLIDKALIKDPVPLEQLYINAVITDSDDITLQMEPNVLGNQVHLVIYPVHRWRDMQLSDYKVLTAIVEELCHALWIITDEDLVKDKVTEVIKVYNPNVNRGLLYPGEALEKALKQFQQALQIQAQTVPPSQDL